ncbi:MAG: peroxiredoxin [Planctomycetes bacterium]|nr:peroxiredoxin [Planctomycetota bacterium]
MTEFRTFDGTDNHRQHPLRGAANTPLLRRTKVGYEDGVSTLARRGEANPNPRAISNLVCAQKTLHPNEAGLSDFVWAWGQFLDHELDLTEAVPGEVADITVEPSDPVLPEGGLVEFQRSIHDPATGTGPDNPRQQINQISAYIDATNVYGASVLRSSALRCFDGTGKLRTTPSPNGDLLPYNIPQFPNAGGSRSDFFLAGDVRANEHVVLTSMHTLFVREHNRRCDQILALEPELDDESVFQRARRIVIGMMQAITFEEFLPAILGDHGPKAYNGYDETVDPGIENLFSTACYRLGHSMLSPDIAVGRSGRTISLREAFFRPRWVERNGIDTLLDGLSSKVMQELDTRAVDDVRNFFFSKPDPIQRRIGDLAALNIQRGRDHGLPGYNQCRRDFGLAPCASFAEVTSDRDLRETLEDLYESVEDIDPWIGGLAEDHAPGAQVGEFFATVIRDQFERVRDGDRFWYQNDLGLSPTEKQEIQRTRLSDVIRRNTSLHSVPDDVFHAPASCGNGQREEDREIELV